MDSRVAQPPPAVVPDRVRAESPQPRAAVPQDPGLTVARRGTCPAPAPHGRTMALISAVWSGRRQRAEADGPDDLLADGRRVRTAAHKTVGGRDKESPAGAVSRPGGDRSVWWRGLDSNQRRRTPTGLQPVPFNHSGTPPGRRGGYCAYPCPRRKGLFVRVVRFSDFPPAPQSGRSAPCSTCSIFRFRTSDFFSSDSSPRAFLNSARASSLRPALK